MAISLSSIKDEILPGLAAISSMSRIRVESYVAFESDELVIKAEVEPGRWTVMRIARYAIEDGNHIAMLRNFLESVMCGSKGSVPMSPANAQALAQYQQLAKQQTTAELAQYLRPTDLNRYSYSQDLYTLTRRVTDDNLYKQQFEPIPEKFEPIPEKVVPQVTAKELTKEELKERLARKLDLTEAEATTAAEVLNHARWRQIVDEVFKDDDKGDDHAKRTEAGSNGGRKRGNGTGGSGDAG